VTRDFKGRAHPKPKGKSKPQRSCIPWFIGGVLLGAFVVGLFWLRLDPALWRSGSGLAIKISRSQRQQDQGPAGFGRRFMPQIPALVPLS